MSQPRFAGLDCSQPWLAPLRTTAERISAHQPWRNMVNEIASQRQLVNHQGMPIHFAAQSELPPGVAYESFISCTGRVPTRDNLHDFFNALVWLIYPLAKARLNAAQSQEIARVAASAVPAALPPHRSALPTDAAAAGARVRGALRDRATVFDENAALLVTSEASVEAALREHDWQQALVMHRADFGGSCEVRLFGHALMEKLVSPYKAITAHVWKLTVERGFFILDETEKSRQVDALLSRKVEQDLLTTAPMALPVLGVPGWWPLQDRAFYDDPAVFRPKRTVKGRDQS